MASRSADRPNIVLVVTDDQGSWAWGRASGGAVDTPTIDALADRGTVLDRFFCASPVCSPARASLLTGRPPSWHGVHDWLAGQHAGPGAVDFLAGQPLVTESLATQGWRVGLSGKWHLGASDVPRQGFEHWFALDGGGSPYDGATFHRLCPDGAVQTARVEGYLTDTIADDAISFLHEVSGDPADERPFFSLVTFTAPHAPWRGQHPEEYVAPHRGRVVVGSDGVPVDQETRHPWLASIRGRPVGCEADPVEALAGYLGSIAAMDAAVGRIVATLESLSLLDSTVIVFTSDNGYNTGHHGIWGKGNGTWPVNMYEESVRVPFIAAGPGIAAATRSDLVSAYDVALTLCEIVGADPSPFADGPGLSFLDVLTGTGSRDADVVVFDEYGDTRMIRTQQWKYVQRIPAGPDELYDLASDPAERHNMVDDPAGVTVVTGLRDRLEAWERRHGSADRRADGHVVSGSGQVGPVPGDGTSTLFNPGGYDAVGGSRWPRPTPDRTAGRGSAAPA